MLENRYLNDEYSECYYRTLITCASFFGRSEEGAAIFKMCNDNKNLQDVINKFY
jgi:hypothetical protein